MTTLAFGKEPVRETTIFVAVTQLTFDPVCVELWQSLGKLLKVIKRYLPF